MATLNTTVAGPKDLLQALVDHLSGDFGTLGRDWTVTEDLRDVDGFGAVIFGNTGASGASPIFIGFNLVSAGDGTHYALCYRVFRSWTAGTGQDFYTTPTGTLSLTHITYGTDYYYCCAVCLPAGATTVFCQSNKDRIVLVCAFSGRYSTNYLGRFLPWGLPSEYPNPIACFGDGVYYDDINGSYSNKLRDCLYDDDKTERYGSIWNPNTDQGDNPHRYCHCVSLPGNTYKRAVIANNNVPDAARRYYSEAPRLLLPLWVSVAGYNPFGQLDGVYWSPDSELAAGSTFTVSGAIYRAFPDIQSMSANHFIAVLED